MEKWELFDKNGKSLNIVQNSNIKLKSREYHLYVDIWVMNEKSQVLLTLRSKNKETSPNMWENTGGSVWANEKVSQAAVRELDEETGIKIREQQLVELALRVYDNTISHIFLVKLDKTPVIKLNPTETIDYKWVSLDTVSKMIEKGLMVPSIKFKFLKIKDKLYCYEKKE